MSNYIFSTSYMAHGIVIQAMNMQDAKKKVREYLCVKRLPNYTTIEKYLFAY